MTVDTGATLTINGTLNGAGSINVPDGSITAAKLATDAVETAKIKDLNVTTGKIASQGVTFAKSLMFVSSEQTGDGMEQSIPHMLGVVPAGVLIVPTDTAPATVGEYTAVEGVHTSTNVLVTVTSGKKYKVWAMG